MNPERAVQTNPLNRAGEREDGTLGLSVRRPGTGGPGRRPPSLLALVDLSHRPSLSLLRELVEAAHAASRRGPVLLLLKKPYHRMVERILDDAVLQTGLGRSGLTCVVRREADQEAALFHSVELLISTSKGLADAGVHPPRELVPPQRGLGRLRELGQSPELRGPDPVFRPIP